MGGFEQHAQDEADADLTADPARELERSLHALLLELPAVIVDDVRAKVYAAIEAAALRESPAAPTDRFPRGHKLPTGETLLCYTEDGTPIWNEPVAAAPTETLREALDALADLVDGQSVEAFIGYLCSADTQREIEAKFDRGRAALAAARGDTREEQT